LGLVEGSPDPQGDVLHPTGVRHQVEALGGETFRLAEEHENVLELGERI
jgi:hypothetical protein